MSETCPTRLSGTCGDCGTEIILNHSNGLGGEGSSRWQCPVCHALVRMDGSNYAEVTS